MAIGQRAMRGRDPVVVMEDLGFGELTLVNSFSVSMSGEAPSPEALNRAQSAAISQGPSSDGLKPRKTMEFKRRSPELPL